MYGSEGRVKNLEIREKELLRQIAAKSTRRTHIALELGVSTFNDGDGNPYDKLLLSTRAALADARNIRLAAEAKMDAFVATGETDITTRSINENILSDPGLNSLKASLNTRRATLLTSISGLSDEHPASAGAKQELAEITTEIDLQTKNLTRDVSKSLVSRYMMTRDQARRYEFGLEQILLEQEKSSARFAVLFNEALTLSGEIVQHNKEVDTYRERLNFFAAERSALGFVRLVTPALLPETPFGAGKKKLLLIVLIAALIAMLAIPVAIDFFDRQIRTVNDAERVLGLPSLGWLIEHTSLATKLFAQDQLRRIAGGLIREQDRHNTRVFALCGVKPGAGSSALSIDLARTLNALGYPTLVVEANAFRPDARFASDKPGLSQCLLGQADAGQCVLDASETLPARVGVGVAAGTTHLDRLDRLAESITQWSEEYRFVLVDMPPLLLSADAEIMINRLGQILLVVEAGGISQGELSRAGRLLEKTASNAVGVIVNRIKPLEGGGYIRKLLIEFLTQRKFSQFRTRPAWHLQVQRVCRRSLRKITADARKYLMQRFKKRSIKPGE
jgi:succinoglycan biosynthesis transport protein ExoP